MNDESDSPSITGSKEIPFNARDAKESCTTLSNINMNTSAFQQDPKKKDSPLPRPAICDSHRKIPLDTDGGVEICDVIPLSPILPVSSPIVGSPQPYGDKENLDDSWHPFLEQENDRIQGGDTALSTLPIPVIFSPVRHLTAGNDDIRHQLLVQRTFNNHEGNSFADNVCITF